MIKRILFFIFLIVSNTIFAQDLENNIYSADELEIKPEFPGGIKKFTEFISENYKVPNEKGLKGEVLVEFIVEKDGKLADIKVNKDIGYGTGIEALRVLRRSPLWIPGKKNGEFVRVRFLMPIVVHVK
jgi:protein TonB